jgi:hypothetical protein
MRQKPFFILVAIVSALFGLTYFFIPDALMASYGATTNEIGRVQSRYFGLALTGLAIIYFMARDLAPSAALTGLLWGGLLINLIKLALVFDMTASGAINSLGWIAVVLHVLLGAGFAYLIVANPASPARAGGDRARGPVSARVSG